MKLKKLDKTTFNFCPGDFTWNCPPVGQQIESAIILYGMTHGSRPHMIETLGKYMFWRNWKKQIQQVADACETCNTLLPSQSNGKPRNNKLSLSKLQPMDCIHIDQFECQGKQFLAVKDYMSTFTWMMRLTATDINHVLKYLDMIQSAFGRIKK